MRNELLFRRNGDEGGRRRGLDARDNEFNSSHVQFGHMHSSTCENVRVRGLITGGQCRCHFQAKRPSACAISIILLLNIYMVL